LVRQALDHIQKGWTSLKSFCQNRFEAKYEGSLLNWLSDFYVSVNPSPYCFTFVSPDMEVAGASP